MGERQSVLRKEQREGLTRVEAKEKGRERFFEQEHFGKIVKTIPTINQIQLLGSNPELYKV